MLSGKEITVEDVRNGLAAYLKKFGRLELTTRQLGVLSQVRFDPISVKELAFRLGATKPAMSRAIDRLAEVGLATREEDPDDRRKIRVYPTEAGAALLSELAANFG